MRTSRRVTNSNVQNIKGYISLPLHMDNLSLSVVYSRRGLLNIYKQLLVFNPILHLLSTSQWPLLLNNSMKKVLFPYHILICFLPLTFKRVK
jgi:ABC-type polysaccharide/polyol phosphate export permease